MTAESRSLGVWIDRPVDEVYEYVSNPANLPQWAAGLGSSIELVDGQWIADSPMGRVLVAFVERNEHGVLDHWVSLSTGESFFNPMRVTAAGAGSELVFTVRRQPGATVEDFDRDASAVIADLETLKRLLEGR